jgi:hypothetical protein
MTEIQRRLDTAGEHEEFLGVLMTIADGRELGIRERVDARSSYEHALADAQDFARRWPEPTRVVVLRRALGPWEQVQR